MNTPTPQPTTTSHTPTHYQANERVVNSRNETTSFLTVAEARELDEQAVVAGKPFHKYGITFTPTMLTKARTRPSIHLRAQPSRRRSAVGHVMAGFAASVILALGLLAGAHIVYTVGRRAGIVQGARVVIAGELCDRAAEVCK